MIINVFIFICSQETRHINAALIQHITFNEFLPMVLGKEVMHAHDLVLLKVTRLSQSALGKNAFKEIFFRTVTLTGTTLTPTRAQPLASPAPPSGGKIFSLFCEVARGRQLNWPASQSVAFYGREISFMAEKYFHGREILQTLQKSPSQCDREDGQRAEVNTISFMPENIGNKDQTPSSSLPFRIKHRSLIAMCQVDSG